jgi:hypothetical protein
MEKAIIARLACRPTASREAAEDEGREGSGRSRSGDIERFTESVTPEVASSGFGFRLIEPGGAQLAKLMSIYDQTPADVRSHERAVSADLRPRHGDTFLANRTICGSK